MQAERPHSVSFVEKLRAQWIYWPRGLKSSRGVGHLFFFIDQRLGVRMVVLWFGIFFPPLFGFVCFTFGYYSNILSI
jgi:hypothetical protein